MVDTQHLEERISETGRKKKFLAEKLGISREYLGKKISGKVDFKTSEVTILCDLLDINTLEEKEKIFFAK